MTEDRPTISTHVLDTGTGQPAAGVPVRLWRSTPDGRRRSSARRSPKPTDGSATCSAGGPLIAGAYRLEFGLDDGGFFTGLSVDVADRRSSRGAITSRSCERRSGCRPTAGRSRCRAPALDDRRAIDAGAADACAAALAPLFEGAPRFLARLCAERPFGDPGALFAVARRVARAMPEARAGRAHRRPSAARRTTGVGLGAVVRRAGLRPRGRRPRRGRGRSASDAGSTAELDRLNAAYEARFGFRYCVFVAGRPRADLAARVRGRAARRPCHRDRPGARRRRRHRRGSLAGPARRRLSGRRLLR